MNIEKQSNRNSLFFLAIWMELNGEIGVLHLYWDIPCGSTEHKHCIPKQFLQFKLWDVFYREMSLHTACLGSAS